MATYRSIFVEDLSPFCPTADQNYEDYILFESQHATADLESLPSPSSASARNPSADNAAKMTITALSNTPSGSNTLSCINTPCNCGRAFRRRSDLKKHVDQHTRPYACPHPTCGIRPFATKHDRARHHREVHAKGTAVAGAGAGGSSLVVCPVTTCKRHMRGFARKENLALHVRNMHPSLSQESQFAPKAATTSSSSTLLQTLPSCDSSPQTSSLPLSPFAAGTPMTGSCSSSTSLGLADDAALLAGLSTRLNSLGAQRNALAQQLASVDETMVAVAKTMEGLQAAAALEPALSGAGLGLLHVNECEWENWDWLAV